MPILLNKQYIYDQRHCVDMRKEEKMKNNLLICQKNGPTKIILSSIPNQRLRIQYISPKKIHYFLLLSKNVIKDLYFVKYIFLFFQYFLFAMEGTDKMKEDKKIEGYFGQSIVRKKDQRISDTSSKNLKLARRGSITNMSFTRNYLNEDSKKFITNVIANQNVGRKETFPKLLLLHLQKKPEFRTNEQIEATAQIFSDQKLFPEFGNKKQILHSISNYATLHLFEENQQIYHENSRCETIFKLFEGTVQIFRNNQGSSLISDNNRQNLKIITEKGDFLQSVQKFSQIKKNSAKALIKTYLLGIPKHVYLKTLLLCQQNKIVQKLLKKTSVFQNFSQKQIGCLLEICPEKKFIHKSAIFKQGNLVTSYLDTKKQGQSDKLILNSLGNTEQKLMYFIIEGQISIIKELKKKQYPICTIGEGNFIGDQALFVQQVNKRPYTAVVSSLYARILIISNKNIQQWIKIRSLGISMQYFVEKMKQSVKNKLLHYQNSLNQSQMIKSSVFAHAASNSLTSSKRQKLKNITNIVGQINQQVEGMEKIKMKRLNFKSFSEEVNFNEPLFTRKDFPTIGSYLKRFENEQKRALQQFKKNRSVHIQ